MTSAFRLMPNPAAGQVHGSSRAEISASGIVVRPRVSGQDRRGGESEPAELPAL